jgi:subfamily B ATP-binding cassette protein MsbA
LNKDINKNIFTGTFAYLGIFRKYIGYRLYIVLALTLFAALSEGIGFALIMPLFQELDDPSMAEPTGIRKILQDFLTYFGWQDSTGILILLIAVAFVLKGFLMFAATGFNAYLTAKLLRELKSKLFKNYSEMKYSYYASRDTGHFINVMNNQINVMLKAFSALMQMCSQFVLGITYITLAFLVTWSFGIMAVFLGIVMFIAFRSLNSYVGELSLKTSIETGNQSKLMIQYLHAFKYLISTNQSIDLESKFGDSLKKLTSYEMKRGILQMFTQSIREPFAVVTICAILFVQLVYLDQPLAPLIVSIMLFYRGLNSIHTIQKDWQGTLDRAGGVRMVSEEYKSQEINISDDGSDICPKFKDIIEFSNVSFSYDEANEEALTKINMKFPFKKSIALVGKSGSGKSTIVDLITLIIKPTKGSLTIDGNCAENIKLSSWRSQIGYVSQDTVIFDDTIANNICMWEGDPNNDLDLMKRIKTAAKQAYIANFIDTLSDGYNTQVGDRGIRLSGGQLQRLFIARELFRKPNILILDEATSALDSESEEYIKQSVDSLKGKVTVIMIAHRLSTIKDVDYLYVLDNGEVIEEGHYQELSTQLDSKLAGMINKQIL